MFVLVYKRLLHPSTVNRNAVIIARVQYVAGCLHIDDLWRLGIIACLQLCIVLNSAEIIAGSSEFLL